MNEVWRNEAKKKKKDKMNNRTQQSPLTRHILTDNSSTVC